MEEHNLKRNRKIIVPSARRLEIALITYLYTEKKIPLTLTPLIRLHDIVFIENLPKAILKNFSKLVNEGLIKVVYRNRRIIKKN